MGRPVGNGSGTLTARDRKCARRLTIEWQKKAAPSLDVHDARRLVGRKGKLANRDLVEGPTSKLHFRVSLRGTGVEYFCQIAAACLNLITNAINCRPRNSGSFTYPKLPPIGGMGHGWPHTQYAFNRRARTNLSAPRGMSNPRGLVL
jgi:hypothetical protein